MLFYLMIFIMILFTVYHFYIDMKGKLNTGNTFAEGMTNARTFKSVEKDISEYDTYVEIKLKFP